jgi:general secretion pathway protein D
LFKTWGDTKQKTNLIIVLTPYIVRTQDDFQKIYERKMQERRAFVDAYFTDARAYNPYVDYDKKTGPLGQLLKALDRESLKLENGGPGLPGESLIGPAVFERKRKSDAAAADAATTSTPPIPSTVEPINIEPPPPAGDGPN